MTITSTKRCPSCNQLGIIVNSNNPVSPGICRECLSKLVSYKDLKAVDKWCRTYNVPFNPDKWIKMAEVLKEDTFEKYLEVVMEENKSSFFYNNGNDNSDLWGRVNEIWNRNLEFNDILCEIESIKDGWLKIQKAKWGPNYEFSEYLKLEDITNSTIRSTGTTNPLTIDTIRKLAITSVMIDRAVENGEVKEAAEYSKMYQNFIKTSGLEDMVDVASDSDVIANIADLCNYLEENGFRFPFYDKVPRDIVDKTIEDQQQWVRRFVLDSAGIIQQEYEIIADAYKSKLEDEKTNVAINQVTLEELIEQKKQHINEEIDEDLDNENFDFDEDDLDDDFKL